MAHGALRRVAVATAALVLGCGGSRGNSGTLRAPEAAVAPPPSAAGEPARDPLAAAQGLLAASRYAEARAAFSRLERPEARLGLARIELLTGNYEQASAQAASLTAGPLAVDAAVVQAEALRRRGRLAEAAEALAASAARPEARRARLLLGEILLEEGKASEAEPYLMSLVEDYNEERVKSDDGFGLAMVGRAAQLLGSPEDANDAFNQAELAASVEDRVLLWRAELFLDNYDAGHAEEVLKEILARAPKHPEALTWMAQVKLAQNLDFDAAAALAAKALSVNPNFAGAFFVRAGIALRDLDFDKAEGAVEKGLAVNPKDLELLSMKAAIRFLADDRAGFEATKNAVLAQSPGYSKLYQIVGDYADWEHRYAEIVDLMREALLTNARDAKVRAQLGLNLIRMGDDAGGVEALERAFAGDPFNARVYNTLNLYQKEIPQNYETVERSPFLFRYHKEELPILDRYVPDMLTSAWRVMREAYGFTPKVPVGIELYPEREHFAVRTSGLPQTFIQGVCFGRTLAAVSPRKERFNVGMTLWHELAHVFHIQKSNSRVPRWFTEGLAEYETLVARPEWAREHDPQLYDALRLDRLPKVASMNRAFSHARDMNDMATAYYASSQIVVMLAEHYGRKKLNRMLDLWGQSNSTEEVVREALGLTSEALDAEFRSWVASRLARYERQFVPLGRADDTDEADARVRRTPNDVNAVTRYAHALLEEGDERATEMVARALALDPKHPDAIWLATRQALAKKDMNAAEKHLGTLEKLGKDGYRVALARAEVAEARSDLATYRKELEKAAAFDPSQPEPWARLARVAKDAGEQAAERAALEKLAQLDQHDGSVYRRLMRVLLDAGEPKRAAEVGESAVYADMEHLGTHVLYGEALEELGRLADAAKEYEAGTLCDGPPKARARAHSRLASVLTRLGRAAAAKGHLEKARELEGAR